MRRFIVVALAGLLAGTAGGCVALLAGGAVGATGYAYATGSKSRVYSQSITEVGTASRDALQELDLTISQFRLDKTAATIRAENAAGQDIRIDIRPQGATTEVTVRVGVFGDEQTTDAIYRRLDERLQAVPETVAAVPESTETK